METVSPAGLAAIKTGSNLTSALKQVAALKARGEYYVIQPGQSTVLWIHHLSATHAHVLVHTANEYRALYRRGQRAPIQVFAGSTNGLYDMVRIDGRWLVAHIYSAAAAAGEQPDAAASPIPVTASTPAAGSPATATAAPLAATATAAPLAATPTSLATATAHPARGKKKPTPAARTATATPAPATVAHGLTVQLTASFIQGSPVSGATSAFPSSTPRLWCVATFALLTPQDAITFKWIDATKHTSLFSYDASPVGATALGVHVWSYLIGPLSTGAYRCEVWQNGTRAGSAPFSVR
jgi:hypothetical protein